MDNKELDMEMEEVSVLTLTDAEGVENHFEYLGDVDYEDKEYIVVTPFEEDAGEDDPCEILILEVQPIDEEFEDYVGVTDENLQKLLFDLFREKYKDLYPFGE